VPAEAAATPHCWASQVATAHSAAGGQSAGPLHPPPPPLLLPLLLSSPLLALTAPPVSPVSGAPLLALSVPLSLADAVTGPVVSPAVSPAVSPVSDGPPVASDPVGPPVGVELSVALALAPPPVPVVGCPAEVVGGPWVLVASLLPVDVPPIVAPPELAGPSPQPTASANAHPSPCTRVCRVIVRARYCRPPVLTSRSAPARLSA